MISIDYDHSVRTIGMYSDGPISEVDAIDAANRWLRATIVSNEWQVVRVSRISPNTVSVIYELVVLD